jgi:hypothetical protein
MYNIHSHQPCKHTHTHHTAHTHGTVATVSVHTSNSGDTLTFNLMQDELHQRNSTMARRRRGGGGGGGAP